MWKQKNFFQKLSVIILVCGVTFGCPDISQAASSESVSVGISIVSENLEKPVVNVQVVDDYFLALSGTTVANGEVHISITGDGGYSKTVTTSADADGDWSYETEALNDGIYVVSCYVEDSLGNRSADSDEKTEEIDLKAPDFSVKVIGEGEIKIESSGGTGFPGGTVHLKITGSDGASDDIRLELDVDGDGDWDDVIDSLLPGEYSVEVFTEDNDGNESPTVSHSFRIEIAEVAVIEEEVLPVEPEIVTEEPLPIAPGSEVIGGVPVLSPAIAEVSGGMENLVDGILKSEVVKKTKEVLMAGLESVNASMRFANEKLKVAAQALDNPIGQAVTTVAAASGVMSIWSIIYNAISTTAGNSFIYFGNSFLLFFQSLWRRGVKNWGTVFESETNMPIDFATVKIYSKDGRVLDSVLTDKEGRFGFLVAEGLYSVEVQKDGFVFPSRVNKEMFDKDLYKNIYMGGQVHFEADQVINFNIPIDVQGRSLRESSKEKIKAMSLPWKAWLRIIQNVIFVAGFLLAIFNVIYLTSLISIVFFLVYVAVIFYQIFGHQKSYGKLIDKATGEPIPFAVVSIFHPQDPSKKIGFVISDMMGRVYRLIENGKYDLNIKGKTLSGHDFHVKEAAKVKNGVLNEKVEINPQK
ncbi:MAG: Ig-like domain-containing protein [Candidatus Moranbacteria bacterium]|nr:Ig-like domain-containing protein [Candidatus Moranbacteria bacterium]